MKYGQKFKKANKNSTNSKGCISRIEQKYKKNSLKIVATLFLLTIFLESSFALIESSRGYIEPFNWGNDNRIAYKLNECYGLFKKNDDLTKVVLMGDSCGTYGFNPILFDNLSDGKTISYNLAVEGTESRFQMLLIQIITEKIQPDVIIWTIDGGDIAGYHDRENIDKMEHPMARYYGNYWEGYSKYRRFLFEHSRIYRMGIFSFEFIPTLYINYDKYERGYYEKTATLPESTYFSQHTLSSPLVDEYYLEMNETIDIMKQNAVLPVFVRMPVYEDNETSLAVSRLFGDYNNVSLDLRGNTGFTGPLFYSGHHLNKWGAELATTMMFDFINDTSPF